MDKIYSRKRIRIPHIKNISFDPKNGNPKDKNLYKAFKIIIIFTIATITVNTILNAITPIIDKQCMTLAKSIATKISNEQATKVMSNYDYTDLCNITKDTSGNITMVSANIITVNEIISDIAIKIQEELNKSDSNSFKIKLGSFFGSKILSGRGPDVVIKMSTIGSLDTELKSEFSSAGINQTLHRIYLQVDCEVSVLTPFNTVEEIISNQVLLAETVIVGTTPNTYYNLEGLNQNNIIDAIE